MARLSSTPLLILLGGFGAATLAIQVLLLPAMAADAARAWPEVAHLRVPVLIGAVAVVACAQAVLVCVARLVVLSRGDRIFSGSAFRWIDAMTIAFALAAVLAAALGFGLDAAAALNPGVALLLGALILGCAAVALLVVVMRALLRRAVDLRDEIAEVI